MKIKNTDVVYEFEEARDYEEPENFDGNYQVCNFREQSNEEAVEILENDGFNAMLSEDGFVIVKV